MAALHIVRSAPQSPEPKRAFSPDESGVRRLPTSGEPGDDVIDVTGELEALLQGGILEIPKARATVPPPVPAAARAIDFDAIVKSCPPKTAGHAADALFPSVPGIPDGFRVTVPPPPESSFDRELALHFAVVWGAALVGGLLALM